jgi:xanthine dehydrogenase accessory factor
MRDEIDALLAWHRERGPFAVATVVGTSSSAPRPAGATLAVHPDGRVVGNVSGGCVEPAVVALAQEVIVGGGSRRARFGFSDGDALAVGLTCGGEVDVLVRRVEPDLVPLEPLAAAMRDDVPVVLVTVVEDPGSRGLVGTSLVVTEDAVHGTIADTPLGRVLTLEARSALGTGGVALRHLGTDGQRMGEGLTVLTESFVDRPRLVILGAIDYAAAVASLGRFLGFHVTVCDARAAFATRERFPDADEVVVEWPHRHLERVELDDRSAVCVLTHDPKFDVPAVVAALRTPARYIGVMGSRRTHEDRLRRLRAEGVTDEQLARLRSPIGLELGGRTPQETAVSIAAELVMLRNRASGRPLTDTDGPIHPVATSADAARADG